MASKMASCDYCAKQDYANNWHLEGKLLVSVLEKGIKFSYQVPNFPVIIVDLLKVKLQLTAEDGSLILTDGFIKADHLLEAKTVPFFNQS